MSVYQALASLYDRLTEDVPYGLWADYIERQFQRAGKPVHTVLDLCCGTGTLSCLLAERGYEVIGVDRSTEMLSAATEKAQAVHGIAPIFLHQSIEHLDLYGTVDACICCLDSLNYIPLKQLKQGLARVHLFLEPDGLFLFDVRPPWMLQEMDGQIFLDEREDLFCIWSADFYPRTNRCIYTIDLFQQAEGSLWKRSQETHVEYAYGLDQLMGILQNCGFTQIRQYGNRKLRPPKAQEDRIFFTARKGSKRQ